RAFVDAAVRGLDQGDNAILSRLLACCGLDGRRGEAGGDLACARPAHSVRDGEDGRLDDERILVAAALASGIGLVRVGGNPHLSYLMSVSPTRITSPGASRRGRSIRVPLTN